MRCQDPAVRGFILGSAVPGTFSAGLNLPELLVSADGSVDALAEYWTLVQELWLTLYTTPLATVAALPGHCIAAGCVLSLSCDGRVMVDGKGLTGLNETTFGLAPPPWLSRLFIDILGNRRLGEDMLMRGLLVNPDEALSLGLVDTTVPLYRLSEEAQSRLGALLAVPDAARSAVKLQLRSDAAEALRNAQSEDLDAFVSLASSDATQLAVSKHLEALASKKDVEAGE